MKAAVLEHYGSPGVFKIKEVSDPELKPGQILVRNRASSVNPIDILVRQGKMKLITGLSDDHLIGSDFSGTVIESKSSLFKVNDEVFGVLNALRGGAYAELLVADEENAALKPSNMSFTEAASLPLVSLTALQGMVDDGKLEKGHKVLILGCTGGVGTAAIQIAKSFETNVTGTCSGKHVDFARLLGCDRVFDYEKEQIPETEKFDLIFDASGNYSFDKFEQNLSDLAIFVSTRGGINDVTGLTRAAIDLVLKKQMKIVLEKPNTADLDKIRELAESGQLKPCISRVFSIENLSEAHSYLENESFTGKVVIEIGLIKTPHVHGTIGKKELEWNYSSGLLIAGTVAAMRSMAAPVVARNIVLNTPDSRFNFRLRRLLSKPGTRLLLNTLAISEMLGDKMPFAGKRTHPLSLTVRALSGAVTAATHAKRARKNTSLAAITGGTAAILASYSLFYLRTRLPGKKVIPGIALGITEDIIMLYLGYLLSKKSPDPK